MRSAAGRVFRLVADDAMATGEFGEARVERVSNV